MDVAECVVRNELVPLPRYEGLWDSIVVDRSVKDRLLRAAVLSLELRTTLPFHVTALHGLAVLTGPPPGPGNLRSRADWHNKWLPWWVPNVPA